LPIADFHLPIDTIKIGSRKSTIENEADIDPLRQAQGKLSPR
jgi:hypothetical protein